MNEKKFIDNCFITLYRLIKNDPEKVDGEIIEVFEQFIPYDPNKSFILISNYYDKYEEDIDNNKIIEHPESMIMLLINYFDYFIVSDVSYPFIKLLIYIALNNEKMASQFIGNGLLDNVIGCLSLKKINDVNKQETLSLIYQLLTIISIKNESKIEIKDTTIAAHLKKDIVKKNVLNFLLISKIKIGPKTVKILSNINLHRSLYILYQFALSDNDHSSMVESSDWLINEIYQTNLVLQMKIFLAVLSDDRCQEKLSRLPQTVQYLLDLVKIKTEELLKLTSTCVRRLMFPSSLDNFQKKHFFKKFWNAIKDDQSVRGPCIMSIDKLVETGYIDDLNDILADMTNVINASDSSSVQAIKIIANASVYPECRHTLRKYKKYFNRLSENANFQNECRIFQKNIQ